jgi:coatomer subunit beta'
MPLRLDIKRKLSARSERVKSVDFHPTEPWILSALYSGHLFIWNYETQALVKSVEVCDLPVRSAKFVLKKQWIVCGSDDMKVRVYNYNTLERIAEFEAHSDYIRSISVHPQLSLLLTASDDMTIKLWDWDKSWECLQVFEGHTHYVMQVEFNPKDTNTFASASLDRSVKVWGLNSPQAHFSLEGHERGVNCIGYFRGGEKPYLISGADDHMIKVWDYQTKACVATLEGHTNNVSAVWFHPSLPVILSGSEDGTVRIWHAVTYRWENTLNYGMERVWGISCLRGGNKVALAYDEGTIMIKLGQEDSVVSMDRNGYLVFAKNHEMLIANVKQAQAAGSDAVFESNAADGERVRLATKELGNCDFYPQSIKHSPDGRMLAVCGDGEYIIYTARQLKNKTFGQSQEFVWAPAAGSYATKEGSKNIKVFKNYKETKKFTPKFAAENIFGGTLLGVRSADFIDFYDWDNCRCIRRIDVVPKKVYWSDSGDLCIIVCDASFYALRYNRDLVAKYFDQGVDVGEIGIENSFDVEQEVQDKVRTGCFIGDCFIYITTNSNNSNPRLSYYVGGEVITLAHLTKAMHLLGYLPKENRVYLMDREQNVISYSLQLSVLVYQTAIVRKDEEAAREALKAVPAEYHNKIAQFLEGQGLKELALEVTTDPDHKFELAMQCQKLQIARQIIELNDSEHKWKTLGDAALNIHMDLVLAKECFIRAKDLSSLLLLYTSTSDAVGMLELAGQARAEGRSNIAFISYLLLHRLDDVIDVLVESGRVPEAAFFARTYAPSQIQRVLALWKADLKKSVSVKAARTLADPSEHADLFPNLPLALQAEAVLKSQNLAARPARAYESVENSLLADVLQALKSGALAAGPSFSGANSPSPVFTTSSVSKTPTEANTSSATAPAKTVASVASLIASDDEDDEEALMEQERLAALEEQRAFEARQAQAQQTAAENAKIEARKQAEAEAAAEAARIKEAQAQAARIKEAQAEAARIKEAEARAQAEAARIKEAQAEAARIKEAEARAQAEAARIKEAEARAQAEAARIKEAQAEAARIKEAEARAQAEAARIKEAQAEAARIKEAEARAQAEAARIKEAQAEAARIQAAAEAQANAEAEARNKATAAAQKAKEQALARIEAARIEAEKRKAEAQANALAEAEAAKQRAAQAAAEAQAAEAAKKTAAPQKNSGLDDFDEDFNAWGEDEPVVVVAPKPQSPSKATSPVSSSPSSAAKPSSVLNAFSSVLSQAAAGPQKASGNLLDDLGDDDDLLADGGDGTVPNMEDLDKQIAADDEWGFNE